MKQFLKFVLATVVGFFLTITLTVLILTAFIAGKIATLKDDKVTNVKPNSILHIQFDYPIKERREESPLENIDFLTLEPQISLGLDEILKNIHKAKEDPNISGIYLDLFYLDAGWAQTNEIREALVDFKKSGKFITSYAEVYSNKAYFLSSVSDKLFLNPEGFVQFNGLNVEMTFYKGLFEKLDIEPQIIRHGKFKAATEPYFLEKMSEENRKQISSFVFSIYDEIIIAVSESRKIDTHELRLMSDQLLVDNATSAVQYGLVDSAYFKDQVFSSLRSQIKLNKNDKINFVSLTKYRHAPDKESYSKNKIALIYGTGTIISGEGDDESLGADKVANAISEARKDSTIKAIVLRVNSPGGSNIASDVVWRELMLTKGLKPVIVSMSDVAASGGYYIACPADSIVAQPFTITGSIGVFGMMFNAQKFFNDKLGITFDQVKTGEFSDLGNFKRPLTGAEVLKIQKEIDRIYDTFVNKVSESRKLTYAEVDSIAQGRIWSGKDALKIGLIDVLGGVNKAIEIAAHKANLDEYRVVSLPKTKDFGEKLMENLFAEAKMQYLKWELGEMYEYLAKLKKITSLQGIQFKMPYDLELN